MSLNPIDFNIPEGFIHADGDPAEDYIGPFFYRMHDNGGIESALRIETQHVNGLRMVHGGVLMAMADYTLGVAAIGREGRVCVTISCNQEFVSPAFKGNLLRGRGELIRKTSSLMFVRCTLLVHERIVMTASGVFKEIQPRS
ncbi:MAG: PaaI family thioesterase [Candidatus Promineifilaceae bacterium]